MYKKAVHCTGRNAVWKSEVLAVSPTLPPSSSMVSDTGVNIIPDSWLLINYSGE